MLCFFYEVYNHKNGCYNHKMSVVNYFYDILEHKMSGLQFALVTKQQLAARQAFNSYKQFAIMA